MDYLKEQVVKAVFDRVKKVDGTSIQDLQGEPRTITMMPQVENLVLQLRIKTPGGPRHFMVIVKEAY